MPALIFLLVIGFVVGIVVLSVKMDKKRRLKWADFAARQGFEFGGMGWTEHPYMSGAYRGVGMIVRREQRGSGKHKQIFTRFIASFGQTLPSGLKVSPEDFGDKISKFFGGQDIQLGIPHADKALRVQGHDEEEIRAFLTQPAMLEAVMRFVKREQGTITEGGATLLPRGFITDENALLMHMDNLVDVVAQVRQALGAPPPQEEQPGASYAAPAAASAAPAAPVAGGPELQRDDPWAESEPDPWSQPGDEEVFPVRDAPEGSIPAPAGGDTLEQLAALAAPGLDSSARKRLSDALKGKELNGEVLVGEITWTSELDLPESHRSGQTIVGKVIGVDVAVCYPSERDAEIMSLRSGQTAQLRGRFQRWDDLYGRAVILGI